MVINTINKTAERELDMINLDEIKKEVKQYILDKSISEETLTDKELSRLFGEGFRRILRYNPQNKNWYYYSGKVWREDLQEMKVRSFAKLFADVMTDMCEIKNLPEQIIAKVNTLASLSKRNTITNDARCEYPVHTEEFDAKIHVLNCENGTLDLHTLELKPHNADDLLSKICNVEYDPTAKCERWEQFVCEVMENDTERVDYLQRVLGYCLTGSVREEEFYILYGATSRNGKSTLLETISHLLGGMEGYAANVEPRSFSAKKERSSSSPSGDIARLAGVRMATTNELPQNMLIDAGMIKTMTGGDKITARALYKSEIEFIPQFKLFINTNHLPNISDDTVFASNRVRVIEFNRHFTEQEQDKTLKDTLRKPENLSGILNWLLDGLRKVRESGMKPPQAVIDATIRYREDCDKVGCFISECLENTGKNSKLKDVYEAYQQWTTDNGFACEAKTKFKNKLISKGIFAKTGTVDGKTEYNVIKGFTLRSEFYEKTPEYVIQTRPERTDPTDIF